MSLRKAREKQNKQDDSQPEATKRVSSASKDVSKRELIRQGEYVQLAALVPKDLVKRLKHLVIPIPNESHIKSTSTNEKGCAAR